MFDRSLLPYMFPAEENTRTKERINV